MPRLEEVRLGELLVQQKLLTNEQLTVSPEEQKRSGRKLRSHLAVCSEASGLTPERKKVYIDRRIAQLDR
jgi:hypothetical protein